MFVSLCLVLACLGLSLSTAAAGMSSWIGRRLRRPRQARALLITVGGVIFAGDLTTAAYLPESARWIGCGIVFLSCVLLAVTLARVADQLIHAQTSSAPRRVLAIGAHPDDLELGCGGTLAKLSDSGHEVRALVMSDGRQGGDGQVRPDEAVVGGAFLGAASTQVVGLPDTRLSEVGNEMVAAIEAAVRRFNPDVVLTHSANDQHQDHKAVHDATLRAARRHPSILCYESPSATRAFDPSFFVDVSDHLDVKVMAIAKHRDQADKPYMAPGRVRSVAAFRGAQARRGFAEAFEPVRMLDTTAEDM